nr:thiamine-phosphate kinase [Desulfobacterales bacterium]
MYVKDIGEFGFIRRISRGCLVRPKHVLKGIGDDAAAFVPSPGDVTLVTTDLLVERVHFLRDSTSGFNLGYKALAANLSDIAAMGGTAQEAFVSIAIPEDCPLDFLEDLYEGMKKLGAEFAVNLLGGDTTKSNLDLIINVAVVGSVPKDEILYRHTAQPEDAIFSTGFLGDSRAGLHLILNNIPVDSKEFMVLKDAHIFPKPYLREGRFLARKRYAHAAIDVSDGLSSDLGHILEESNVGARLYAEKIPVSQNLKKFCDRFEFDPVDFALAGGEDYTLLCTIPTDKAEEAVRDYVREFNQPLYPIGEINDSGRLELVYPDGKMKQIKPTGWDHFKSV